MVLGNAWEAPVAWAWLLGTLGIHDGNTAVLIEERIKEIDSKYLNDREDRLPDPLVPYHVGVSQRGRIKKVYAELRANGEKWAQHRERFMVEQLQSGKHPDIDTEFWLGYVEVPPFALRDGLGDILVARWRNLGQAFIDFVIGGIVLIIGVFIWKRVGTAKRA